MLMMIDVSDSATIYDICNDTLGGYTSIDSRRFAEEFIRRRRMDASHGGNWETITSGPSSASSSNNISGFETTNKFVVVGKKKKGGK